MGPAVVGETFIIERRLSMVEQYISFFIFYLNYLF